MSFAVVIPSRDVGNLVRCIAAIRQHEPGCRIIAVDDGLPLDCLEGLGLEIVPGVKPFVFARNCNLGIGAAGQDDAILLNDDALLQTPGGFSLLADQAVAYPEYGIIAAASNNVGNLNQNPKGIGLRDELRMVCFTCLYLPRTTLETVGLLDERFVHYGIEDDDYCLRVRKAGLKIGIYDGCVVDHKSLPSSYRGTGGGDYRPNLEIFKQKWGMDNYGRSAQ